MWTQARRRGFSLADVARWMAERPARLAGLAAKGQIAAGYDADFCVFAPEESFTVDPGLLQHRHPVTPYAGRTLPASSAARMLRGAMVDPARPRAGC